MITKSETNISPTPPTPLITSKPTTQTAAKLTPTAKNKKQKQKQEQQHHHQQTKLQTKRQILIRTQPPQQS